MKLGQRIKVKHGHFKGNWGRIVRLDGLMACIVMPKVWDHGVWVFKEELQV